MKKNKKGFTLVEMLAVVVVLIIIIILAINKIKSSVDNAAMNSVRANAYTYIKAINNEANLSKLSKKFKDGVYYKEEVFASGITMSGTKPDKGSVLVFNGEVQGACLKYDKYIFKLNGTDEEVYKGNDCSVDVNAGTSIVQEVPYSGSSFTYSIPTNGKYKLEVWGAQGGSSTVYQGGKGGYSVGIAKLKKGDKLYVYVGGHGQDDYNGPNAGILEGGFNGGGYGRGWSHSGANGGGGGGATDVRLNNDSLYARLIVAGGGGGTSDNGAGGYGGGLNSNSSATQTTGAAFGKGQDTPYTGGEVGGGGSGWYGGTAGSSENVPGNGGSGYVYTSTTASNYPSGCLLKSSNYLTDASTFAGNETFKSPTGNDEVGHSSDGHARITYLGITLDLDYSYEISFGYEGKEVPYDIPMTGKYKLEVWGAQGGNAQDYIGGYGGYSSGLVTLNQGDKLYINVGGQGSSSCVSNDCDGGYNGGGKGQPYTGDSSNYVAGGGGATSISTKSGEIKYFDEVNDKDKILIIAGGGAGAYYHTAGAGYSNNGSSGGGVAGVNGLTCSYTSSYATGGTQTTAGAGGYRGAAGSFGQGGTNSGGSSGGGGGLYGGGASAHAGAAGGSGYIKNSLTNKEMYCYNCTESNNESTKTVSITCADNEPKKNCAKKGNGYARITFID